MAIKVTQDRLKELMVYSEESGLFVWNFRKGFTGRTAGSVKQSHGYVAIMIDGVSYLAHRLAFLYVDGVIPRFVDHVNRDKTDNSWSNLRPATASQNGANSVKSRTKASGLPKGVFKNGSGYMAQIVVNSKTNHLGTYRSIDEATDAYRSAAIEYFGEYALCER